MIVHIAEMDEKFTLLPKLLAIDIILLILNWHTETFHKHRISCTLISIIK